MASETQPPSTSVGLFAEPAPSPPEPEPPTKKRREPGANEIQCGNSRPSSRTREWCATAAGRSSTARVAKVERVRAHFERKCPGVHAQATPPPRGNEATGTTETGSTQSVVGAEIKQPRSSSGNNYGNKSGAFKRKFAYWLYATGQSFEDGENELLLNALKVLRSDATLPSKLELENELLDLEFIASKSKVAKALSGKKCCLTVENWVDAGGCGVATFGATCEGVSYYLDSKTATSQDSGGELTADEVEAAVEFPDSSSMSASLEALLKHEKVLYAIVARRDFVDTSAVAEQEKLKRFGFSNTPGCTPSPVVDSSFPRLQALPLL
ncbi:hypothetical protein GQ600_1019 [Phytophthora cactorum]|nr:hypothetical protein GQ600_1019 [Phytophthora cactorum]